MRGFEFSLAVRKPDYDMLPSSVVGYSADKALRCMADVSNGRRPFQTGLR